MKKAEMQKEGKMNGATCKRGRNYVDCKNYQEAVQNSSPNHKYILCTNNGNSCIADSSETSKNIHLNGLEIGHANTSAKMNYKESEILNTSKFRE